MIRRIGEQISREHGVFRWDACATEARRAKLDGPQRSFINAAFNLSFAVWIMHSFFAGVPKEIDEAAQIDGAGRLAVLFRINLPLVWPGIVTAIVFTFVACWNEFAASLVILSTAGNQPLSVALTKFVGQYETSWQYVFGISIVAIIPVVVLFMHREAPSGRADRGQREVAREARCGAQVRSGSTPKATDRSRDVMPSLRIQARTRGSTA